MKKTLAVLLALVLVGAAFAQDPAPAKPAAVALVDLFTKAPAVTYGADAGLTFSMIEPNYVDTNYGTDGMLSKKDRGLGGNAYFTMAPWAKFDWSGISFKGKAYYSPQNGSADFLPYIGASPIVISEKVLFEGNMTYTYDGLTLSNTVYYDPKALVNAMYTGAYTLKTDNVEAKLTGYAVWDGTNMALGNIGAFEDFQLGDTYFKINNIFGKWSVKAGGNGSNLTRAASLFTTPFWHTFASQSTIGRQRLRSTGAAVGAFGSPYVMRTDEYALFNTLALGDLTVYGAFDIPTTGVALYDWFAANNALLAAKYALKDIGSVAAGWNVGIGYDMGLQLVGPLWVKGMKGTAENQFFVDFNYTGMKNLNALVSFDLAMGNYAKQAASTGTGTLADPVVVAGYLTSTVMNFGLEAKYDFAEMVKGLTVDVGAYLAINGGKTYNDAVAATDTTFAQYLDATYPTATFYRMASLTEANWLNNPTDATTAVYKGYKPFKGYLKAAYAINDTIGAYFKNTFVAQDGELNATTTYYASAVKKPVGYYNTNKIALGADITAGKGSLNFEAGYKLYLGLPSAADMGYTDNTVPGAVYKSAADQAFDQSPAQDPYFISITYGISF